MKQITEDFVSFETAKLLKEKGFDEPTLKFFHENGKEDEFYDSEEEKNSNMKHCCSRPSQSLALKWMREVHKIHINFDIHWLHFANQNGWIYLIEKILDNGTDYIDSKGDENDKTFYSTYESCVEAAIKYTLEKLI